jgi:hypothetical protein
MAITITSIGKTNPTNPNAPMLYYPKVTKTWGSGFRKTFGKNRLWLFINPS